MMKGDMERYSWHDAPFYGIQFCNNMLKKGEE